MFEIFVDLFFKSTRNDFPSSPKALKRPCFGQIFCAAGKILKKKQAKKGVFRQFLGSITKYGYLKIVQRGTLWVGRGSNPRRRRRPHHHPPPLNPPLLCSMQISKNKLITAILLKNLHRAGISQITALSISLICRIYR